MALAFDWTSVPESGTRAPTLRRRLMLAFALFALGVAALFTLHVLVIAYVVEDRYIAAGLELEAQRQLQARAAGQTWLTPVDPAMQVLPGPAQFPADLYAAWAQDPQLREFAGSQGRHYHLLPLETDQHSAWLVTEVGERLVFRRMRGDVVTWLGGSVLATLAVALLLGWWVAGRASEPLRQLAAHVQQLDPATVASDTRISPPRSGRVSEVDVLAQGLDGLLQRMARFIERERHFTHDASHELRTPLTVIRQATEQLRERAQAQPDLDAAERQAIERLWHSTSQLQQTLQILLAMAREAAPTAQRSSEVLPVLERVIVEQSIWHGEDGLQIHAEVPSGVCIALPAEVLHVALANLVGNACQHALADAAGQRQVLIDVAQGDAGPQLRIANAAQSPLPADAHQPFRKGEHSSGLGLGLAIVQRLSEHFGLPLSVAYENGQLQILLPLQADLV